MKSACSDAYPDIMVGTLIYWSVSINMYVLKLLVNIIIDLNSQTQKWAFKHILLVSSHINYIYIYAFIIHSTIHLVSAAHNYYLQTTIMINIKSRRKNGVMFLMLIQWLVNGKNTNYEHQNKWSTCDDQSSGLIPWTHLVIQTKRSNLNKSWTVKVICNWSVQWSCLCYEHFLHDADYRVVYCRETKHVCHINCVNNYSYLYIIRDV